MSEQVLKGEVALVTGASRGIGASFSSERCVRTSCNTFDTNRERMPKMPFTEDTT